MRAYSERNLMQAEIKGRSPFLKLITPSKASIKISLPDDVYFRMKNLCDDVTKLIEEQYRPDDLLQLLLDDIVDHVRETQDVKGMHQLFLERDKSTYNVRLKYYQKREEETEPLYPMKKPQPNDEIKMVYMRLVREDILRMEILFSDMAELFPNHHFTVERVLEILLIDFIEKYKRGEAINVIKSVFS
ncbi:hypothetical protein JCM9140_3231 [Halalkalibacter wakoensis JCM 9140]|uniref:Uncharacterized protein n=1 Tax=Halalkalibacter wakoensis JCM 9140 TaxID=1236970 RepID=W4Q592_9BACI|nr:hypothetical protein [Halalkalibacter wakoensis]GAE27115.1 hypothetical protein JCM9140_3231 [Halalkalibacter wakoensis JCM 9140]